MATIARKIMRKLLLCLALFVPLVAFGQISEDAVHIRDYSLKAKCPKVYSDSELGLKACTWDKFYLAEERLDHWVSNIKDAYFEDMKEFMPASEIAKYKLVFIKTQSAWKKYRDLECGDLTVFNYYGGNGVSLFMAECNLKHTLNRIEYLKERYPFKSRG